MTPSTTTVGVAIAVPEPFGSLLRDARAQFGDEMAATIPTHITLTPPAEVEPSALGQLAVSLETAAATVAPYSIRLRGTGTFRPVSPVVYVAVSEGAAQTEQLAHRVRGALGHPALEFPYHPHVTVAHHLDDPALDHAYAALAGFECEFRVAEFALYHQVDHTGWKPERHFALGSR
ncbi:MAG: 2'-5' RNA ligase family protein [Aeromicrobium sp.]|uniref:2'-5' RNA ligase family protein n=1 Tax=Aeromicrobium sp. TaxID=1871063 RepID=UPI003C3B270C